MTMTDNTQVAQVFLQESIRAFENMKKLADKAFAQTEDAHFYLTLDEESNSLELLIKHMHGNMLSRWTDFLTTDGEKETRQRDGEFESSQYSREELISFWEEGWKVLFDTLHALTPDDVLRTVQIRGEGHLCCKPFSAKCLIMATMWGKSFCSVNIGPSIIGRH